jgi:hypothetical protein
MTVTTCIYGWNLLGHEITSRLMRVIGYMLAAGRLIRNDQGMRLPV